MNVRNYKTFIELLKSVNASLVAYAFIITILFSIGIPQYVPLSMLIMLIPIISRYLEYRVKHIITFMFCHIILGLFFFLVPQHFIVKIIYLVYSVIIMIYHFYRRVRRKFKVQDSMFSVCLFLLIVMQIYANWRKYGELSRIILIISSICIIFYFVQGYLSNFTDFFTDETLDISVNLHQIKRVNHTLMLVFLSIITLIMIGSSSIPTNIILSKLKSFVIYLLRLFFSLFTVSRYPEEVKEVRPIDITPILEGIAPSETPETNPTWLLIQNILMNVCFVAIVLAIATCIIYAIYRLCKHFNAAKTDATDKKEFISPFFKEDNADSKKKIQKAKLHLFLNHNEKIRRYFYQVIKKKYKEKVPSNLTADELLNLPVQSSNLLLSEEPGKLDPQILSLYHKARYSNGLCSKEEFHQMKKIIKEK